MIIDLVYPLLPLVGSINSFCIVIWDFSSFAGLCNGISLFVNESYKFSSLVISDLDILAYHFFKFSDKKQKLV